MRLLAKIVRLAAAGTLLSILSGVVNAELPQGEFACQVMTSGARIGIVLVQVDDRQAAVAVAARSPARTFSGAREQTARVVQCIRLPAERFTDVHVQHLFERSAG